MVTIPIMVKHTFFMFTYHIFSPFLYGGDGEGFKKEISDQNSLSKWFCDTKGGENKKDPHKLRGLCALDKTFLLWDAISPLVVTLRFS